ncbi:hypothetical protein HELRODRAFT_185675 [Helobdella robusta]|uniref:Hro-nos n=1 Tax=Helobdella robusta TaxID=6412 RepID=O18467_HELRO|nr:hypothetical protein HELRODRAFT_185675 [Helobdella robusta]AAB63111.1 Hro-nos [Helobdella robusta]ESO03227.1 hypothetical protein HELRODRAFT_185675 [Helobdella robusta]
MSSTSSRGLSLSLPVDSDELGLRTLGNFYAPHLNYDIERLFLRPDSPESDEPSQEDGEGKSVWKEFEKNGQDAELDELDRLFRGMNNNKSSVPSVSNDSGLESHSSTPISGVQQIFDTMLSSVNILEILKERERLHQRTKHKTKGKSGEPALVCVFCRNNKEPECVANSHLVKDEKGQVTCPILYIYTCPICGATGKAAHTIKYCPYNTGERFYVPPLTRKTGNRSQDNVGPVRSSFGVSICDNDDSQ